MPLTDTAIRALKPKATRYSTKKLRRPWKRLLLIFQDLRKSSPQ